MTKKKFVTLFDRTENFHLVKDVGQIPYHMHKEFDYDSEIVTCKNDSNYSYLEKEVKGLKIDFIPKIKLFKINLGVILYLLKNAKNIDVLNQFHIRNYTLMYACIYKLLNKNGITYIKADANEKELAFRKKVFKKKYLKSINKYIDLLSFETKNPIEQAVNNNELTSEKMCKITNGIDENYVNSLNLKEVSFSEKDNSIVYVARVGTYQKNTELFLKILEKVDLKDWKVNIIGSIEKKFKPTIDEFFSKNPHLKNNVTFLGNITSREKIYELYSKSKVFCITSRYEGFPLVFPEALYFGNYIVSTDISGANDITNNGKLGKVVKDDNINEFAAILKNLIETSFLDENMCNEIKSFAKKEFTWQSIVKDLDRQIKGIKK